MSWIGRATLAADAFVASAVGAKARRRYRIERSLDVGAFTPSEGRRERTVDRRVTTQARLRLRACLFAVCDDLTSLSLVFAPARGRFPPGFSPPSRLCLSSAVRSMIWAERGASSSSLPGSVISLVSPRL